MVLSLHIRASFGSSSDQAPIDHLMVLACQISAITAQDLLFGPTLRQFPDLRVALSEGGIGWIPFYFDRIDRHFDNQSWLHDRDWFGGKKPSEVFRDHILACYITDPSGLLLRDRIGIDNIAWECDYPHTDTTWPNSPEQAWGELTDAGCTPEEIDKITFENACRFFDWDPFQHTKREDATVGALRARRGPTGSTRPACPAPSGRRATRPPASASPDPLDPRQPVSRGAPHGLAAPDLRLRQPLLRGHRRLHPPPGQGVPQPRGSLGRDRRSVTTARRRPGEQLHRQPDLRPGGQAGRAVRLVSGQPRPAEHRAGVRRARADPARVSRPRRPPGGDGRAGRGRHPAVPDPRRRRRGRTP